MTFATWYLYTGVFVNMFVLVLALVVLVYCWDDLVRVMRHYGEDWPLVVAAVVPAVVLAFMALMLTWPVTVACGVIYAVRGIRMLYRAPA